MTDARMHIPGQTAHMIRRCRRGQFLLTPCDSTNAVMAYEVAHSATRYGLEISGFVAMSNHYHIMTLDPLATRSDFMQKLNRDITRRLKPRYEYYGSTWAEGPYTDVHIGPCRELETLVYIWTNPVKDNLVERPEDWPGFQVQPEDWGEEQVIKKPDAFYGRSGPEEIRFTPRPPSSLRHLPLDEAKSIAIAKREERLEQLAKRRRQSGRCVWGRKAVQNTPHTHIPSNSPKTKGPSTRFSFACPTAEEIAKQLYRDFLDDYETQRLRWKIGQDVQFPCGTLKLNRQAPILCKDAPDDHPGLYRDPSSANSDADDDTAKNGTQRGREDVQHSADPTKEHLLRSSG